MIRFLPFLLLLFGCCVASCSKSTDDTPNVRFSLDDELYITLWEELDPTGSTLVLNVQTIEDQACEDTQIAYTYKEENKAITLSLNGLISPDNCIDNPQPAVEIIPLGRFAPDVYDIQINLQEEIVNQGKLSIYSDRYEIDMETLHGIDFKSQRLLKVPNHTYWGYVGYHLPNLNHANDFMDEISALAQNSNLAKGDYGHFLINDNDEVELPSNTDLSLSKTFIFYINDDESSLKELLQKYRTTLPQELDIRVYSFQGLEL